MGKENQNNNNQQPSESTKFISGLDQIPPHRSEDASSACSSETATRGRGVLAPMRHRLAALHVLEVYLVEIYAQGLIAMAGI
jgi:hypothetical protein